MTVAFRHDDLRRRNRAMVIASVRRFGQASRTEIAAATGLSHSTISSIVADLLAEAIIEETRDAGPSGPRRGRPQVAIRVNPEAASAVTISLLYNLLTVAFVDALGRPLVEERRRLSTAALAPQDLVGECVALVRRVAARREAAGRRIDRIVLAVQGTTDAARRQMLWSPITPHERIDFAAHLEAAFDVPVTVENDCNMLAVALQWKAPERYRDDFIAVLLSHGIGMGLVRRGELITGAQTSGGEFGHMVHQPGGALCRCGRRGCVEAYAGDYAISRFARGRGDDEPPIADIEAAEIAAIAEAAQRGEGTEREAFRRAGTALGYGLGSLFALIDPAPVTFIGVSRSVFELIEPSLREALERTAGGRRSGAISFDIEPDGMPLLAFGCAMRALTTIDQENFAAGVGLPHRSAGEEVA